MGLARVVGAAVNRALRTVGYSVARRADGMAPTFGGALVRLSRRGHQFNTVIDVGASNGSWSADLLEYFPNPAYFLVEANPVHEPALVRFCKTHPSVSYVLAAAGERSGFIYFDASDPFGGVATDVPTGANVIEVPCVAIDDVVAEMRLTGPFLIKLDTHGFEVAILDGARRTLESAAVLVIECYNFKIAPQAKLFYEMCQYLDSFGFRCIDMFDPMYRPSDHAFWQCDIVFARKDRPEFDSCEYR